MLKCAECKGKGMCGLPRCPVVSRFHAQAAIRPMSTYQGSSPSVFIGSFGYPDMRGGPLLINDSDNPPDWIRNNLGIEEIVGIRARTIRGSSERFFSEVCGSPTRTGVGARSWARAAPVRATPRRIHAARTSDRFMAGPPASGSTSRPAGGSRPARDPDSPAGFHASSPPSRSDLE